MSTHLRTNSCYLGCRTGAKWDATVYLKEAQSHKGTSLITGIKVTKVLTSNGRAIGIEGYNNIGRKMRISANTVILAAGGLETPVILQNSGIKAGQKLFLHLFRVTMGLTKDTGLTKEPQMQAVRHEKGFILSTFLDEPGVFIGVLPRKHALRVAQRARTLGIMTKIKDDCLGRIHRDGRIEKQVTQDDLAKLKKGAAIAQEVLINAGVDPRTILTSAIRGAHPGGTAAIGEVVNQNLETEIKGLFVCDGSVLPNSTGLPPILAIIALSKKFAKTLVMKQGKEK